MSKRKIIMTGGGSAGHVTPNLALIPKLKELGFEVQYIGTKDGIEKGIIEKAQIKYHVISSGKLRRYFDLKNFSDPLKVIKGVFQASNIIKREKPDVVFSKGGFVSVPVVMGAYFNKVPVIAHESDMTPGLANKLSMPFCTKICVTFPESLNHLKKGKAVLTGTPIREEILKGDKVKGLKACGFDDKKPVIMVIGGSLGAKSINDNIRKIADKLLERYYIVHICGKGNYDESMENKSGYKQYEYVSEELPHIMNAADIVISRAGANVIFELLAIKKPNLLIPLSAKQSRGDQILNAESFRKSGYSLVLQEEDVSEKTLLENIEELYKNRDKYIKKMSESSVNNGVDGIIQLIQQVRK